MGRETQVRVLGPVVLVHDGETSPVGTPRQRAVLALLAMNAGKPVHRERIVDLLWDEAPPPTAIKTIQAYVSRLRKQAGLKIDANGPTYTLDVDAEAVDALRFIRLHELASDDGARDPAQVLEALDAALAEWRGAPLVDLVDTPASLSEAVRFDERRLRVLEDRWKALLDLGRAGPVVTGARVHTRQHPWRERGWQLLMIALHREGRTAEALRAFQDYRDRLGRELGLEPSDELRSLEAAIAGDGAAHPEAAKGEPDCSTRGPASFGGTRAVARVHMVGRGAELQRLDEWWSASNQPLLIIEGEPGIGKSTLLAAFERRVATTAQIAGARCHEGLGQGLEPVVDLVESALAGADDTTIRSFGDAEALAVLCPALLRGAAPVVEAGQFEHRLASAAVDALVGWARNYGPALITVDDAQWCGAAGLAVLRRIVGKAGNHIKLCLTARSVDRGDDAPWRRFADEIHRDVEPRRLAIAGLTAEELEGLLPDGRRLTSELATQLEAATSGHPLFAAALLQELERNGALDALDGGLSSHVSVDAVAMPDAVRAMVDRRIREAGGDLAGLDQVASLDDEIDEDLVVEVVGLEPDPLLDLLDAAVEADLVDTSEEGVYRFRHRLLRGALAARVSERRRQRLQLAAFNALRQRPGGRHQSRALRFGLNAGCVAPGELADVATAAAEHAAATFVPADEVAFRRIAVEQLAAAAVLGRQRIEAEIALGVAMVRNAERGFPAQRVEAMRLAREAGEVYLLAKAALRVGLDYALGPTPERIPELREALDLLEATGSVEGGDDDLTVEVRAGLAGQLWSADADVERRDLIIDALDETAGRDDITRVRVLASATWAQPGVTSVGSCAATAGELVPLARRHDRVLELATGLNTVAATCLMRGDLAGGEAAAGELTEVRHRYRLPVLKIVDDCLRAGIEILHARLDNAWEIIGTAIDTAEVEGVAAVGLGPLGRPVIELATERSAIPRIPPELFEFGDMLDSYAPYRMSKLYARFLLGDETARGDLDRELATVDSFARDIGRMFAANRLALVVDFADIGDADTGRLERVLDDCRGYVDWSGSASSGPASLWLAVLGRRRGVLEETVRWLAEAEEFADALDAPLWKARILRERALLARLGGPSAAGASDEARRIADTAGADLLIRLLDRDGL